MPAGLAPSTKVNRKPSFEEKYLGGSPVNSENSSVRSESPGIGGAQQRLYVNDTSTPLVNCTPQIVPSGRNTPPPPLPPRRTAALCTPRGSQTPPPVETLPSHESTMAPPGHVQQMIKKMSLPSSAMQRDLSNMRPAATNSSATPHRGMSPVLGRHSVLAQQQQQQAFYNSYAQQQPPYKVLSNGSGGSSGSSSPAQQSPSPYQQPLPASYPGPLPSPTLSSQSSSEQYVAPSSYYYGDDSSSLSSQSPSPAPTNASSQGCSRGMPKPVPAQAWSARPLHIVKQKVHSREVQKPVLQNATVPQSPQQQQQLPANSCEPPSYSDSEMQRNFVSSVQAQVNTQPQQYNHVAAALAMGGQRAEAYPHPAYRGYTPSSVYLDTDSSTHMQNSMPPQQQQQACQYPGQIQIHIQNHGGPPVHLQPGRGHQLGPYTPSSTPRSESPVPRNCWNHSPQSVISTTSTPSTNSDIPDKPPPPYPGRVIPHHPSAYQPPPAMSQHWPSNHFMHPSVVQHQQQQHLCPSSEGEMSAHPYSDIASSDREDDKSSFSDRSSSVYEIGTLSDSGTDMKEKHLMASPKPKRKAQRDPELQMRHFSPQAFKFFMEQHVENVLQSHRQRVARRKQLEQEMAKVQLSDEARQQMTRMLQKKESNYLRLKRAKMDRGMFEEIKLIGVGAFGEVSLVRRHNCLKLYAMKTLRKNDVLRRNQVAHVKAERDILAEADNEWVVKLYYSFQDEEHLYFVMDYIPGGDMMSLLIKKGIFEEPLARFYIAELTLAIESVHKMGFIHRDIKPDNILIDKDGHIKLTDFGLCTGFRWTHDSKYYQNGKAPISPPH